jgi:hypothetical protein
VDLLAKVGQFYRTNWSPYNSKGSLSGLRVPLLVGLKIVCSGIVVVVQFSGEVGIS